MATKARSSKRLKTPETSKTVNTLETLSAESRSAQARKAVRARWEKSAQNRTLKKFLQSLAKNYTKEFGDHPALLAELVEPLTNWAESLGPSPVTEEEVQFTTTFLMEGIHHA